MLDSFFSKDDELLAEFLNQRPMEVCVPIPLFKDHNGKEVPSGEIPVGARAVVTNAAYLFGHGIMIEVRVMPDYLFWWNKADYKKHFRKI